MNQLQTSLFEAMKAFADNAQKNSNATLTVEASIIEVIDEGKGEYKVNYLGQKFSAFSNNPSLVYSVGDDVFVLVPDGNFDKKKTILGLSSLQASYTTVSDDEDNNITYYDLSDNLLDFTRLNNSYWENGTLKLSSYDDISAQIISPDPVSFLSIDDEMDQFSAFNNSIVFIDSLNNYLKYSRVLKLSFLVKTDLLLERQNSGKYGIAIFGIKENRTFTPLYSLNTDNMIGNPYRYTQWTPQTLYITIDDDIVFSLERGFFLHFFCYGFPISNESSGSKDIFIKDISLKSVTPIVQDENGYILTLNATEGLFFNEGYNPIKKITPTLKVSGKTVNFMNSRNTKVFWFRQNNMINAESDRYLSYAGPGWECLNEYTGVTTDVNGSITQDWVSNVDTLTVNKKDVYDTMTYKCIIIYDGKQVSATIDITNTISNAFIVLNTTTGSKQYVKNAGKVEFVTDLYFTNDSYTNTSAYRNRFVYYWSRRDKKGKYIDENTVLDFSRVEIFESSNGISIESLNECVSKNVRGIVQPLYESIFSIPVSLIDESNTFYCTAIYLDDNNNITVIGTKEITITTTNYEGYQLIVDNENTLYKYDVDGDSPMGEAYDGTSTSKITATKPLTFRVNKPNGDELTDSEYQALHYIWKIPKKSLFVVNEFTDEDDDYKYVRGTDGHDVGLSYLIADRFDRVAANQKVTLTVDFNNETIEKQINIIFMKEGDSGTNGTAYAAVLVSGDWAEENCTPYSDDKKLIFKATANGNLYYFNYESSVWYKLQNNNRPYPIFPRVYRDSILLDPSDYDIEYSMFDSSENSGKAHPYFKIHDGDEGGSTSNKGIEIYELSGEYDYDNVNCTVLQAKITVRPGNDSSIEAPQIIYAYYPIDIFYVYDNMYWGVNDNILPKINNGFSQVMYEPDGTNPSYDDSQFTFDLCTIIEGKSSSRIESILNDENNYYTITAKGDILENDTIIKGTLGSHLKQDGTPTISESGSTIAIKVKPDMKYDDGDTQTYVSLIVTQNNAIWNYSKLSQKYSELTTQRSTLSNQLDIIENARNELRDFASNFYFNDWIDDLKDLQNFLNKKQEGIIQLQTILHYCSEILSYINIQKTFNNPDIEYICSSTIDAINDLAVNATQAMNQINHLDNSPGYTPSDLISLDVYEIPWDSTIEENYKQNLGLNCMITIRSAKDDINNSINSYQTVYNDLHDSEYTSQISNFNNIIEGITIACGYISRDNLPEYIDLKQKVLTYLDEFKKHSSITELINILNQMYFNVLRNTFNKGDSHLTLSTITTNYFNKLINNLEMQISSINAMINYIDDCRGRWYDGLDDDIILARYVRSIPIYFNRLGLAALDAWDGNKIDIGDDYMYSPQFGAGKKNEDNTFTGLLMGVRKPGKKSHRSDYHIGLFGYNADTQTLFLDAERGSAIFGTARAGQLYIDPETNALMIYSSNYWSEYNQNGYPSSYRESNMSGEGLCINFSEPSIKYGSGKFTVDADGNAHIGGNGDSEVGGWDIYDTYLASANFKLGKGIKLDAANDAIIFGSSDGVIYSGKHSTLNSTQAGFYLSNQGISIGDGFYVNREGKLRLGNYQLGGYFEVGTSDNKLVDFDPYWNILPQVGYLAYNSSKSSSYESYKYFGAYLPSVKRYYTDQMDRESTDYYYDTQGNRHFLKWNYLEGMHQIFKSWQIGGDLLEDRIDGILYNKSQGLYLIKHTHILPPMQFVGSFNQNEVYIGADGIRLGKYFAVNNEGSLQAIGSYFSHCSIDNTYLEYALIKYARLEGDTNHPIEIKYASLEGDVNNPISLRYSHLYNVTIDNAVIDDVTITNADIDYVNINNVLIEDNLTLPAGRNIEYFWRSELSPEHPIIRRPFITTPFFTGREPGDYTKYYIDLGYVYPTWEESVEVRATTNFWAIQSINIGILDAWYPDDYTGTKTGECKYIHFYMSTEDPYDPDTGTYHTIPVGEKPIYNWEETEWFERQFKYDTVRFMRHNGGSGSAADVYGNFLGPSDIRYKNVFSNWITTELSKKIICGLNPIAYEYKDKIGVYHRGFSAQQVQQVFEENNLPEMVYQYDKENDIYFLSQQELIPDLVNCIQDLYKQIQELKEKIENEHTT